MGRAIRLIAGLAFATLLGVCAGNSVNAQEVNTRQASVQVGRQSTAHVSRQGGEQVTRQGGGQVSRQAAVQVTRGQTGPLTQSRADARKAAIEYQMNQARERFPDVDMDVRSRDLDLRRIQSEISRFGDTDVDARLQDTADSLGVRNVGAARSLKHAPLISHVDKKNQGGSAR